MISNDIVVSLLCEELHSKASHITNGVCSATFTGSCAQSPEDRSLFSDSIQEFRTCVFRDVIGDFEFSPCTGGFRMNDTKPILAPYNLDMSRYFKLAVQEYVPD